MTPQVNPESIKNLKPRYAPDKPGETVSLGVRVRLEQREALDKLCAQRGTSIGVLIREALDSYLSNESPSPVESTPAPLEVDTVELLPLIEQAMGMTKAKDIKTVLATMRELLSPGAGETVSEIEQSSTPPGSPLVDIGKLTEVRSLVARRLDEGNLPRGDFRIYSAVLQLLTQLASSGD